jgi:hypothetical protein
MSHYSGYRRHSISRMRREDLAIEFAFTSFHSAAPPKACRL